MEKWWELGRCGGAAVANILAAAPGSGSAGRPGCPPDHRAASFEPWVITERPSRAWPSHT